MRNGFLFESETLDEVWPQQRKLPQALVDGLATRERERQQRKELTGTRMKVTMNGSSGDSGKCCAMPVSVAFVPFRLSNKG